MAYTGDKKREYQRRWIAKRRAEFFDGKSCEKCGSKESLELDHIDQATKVSHNIWSWTEVKRLSEIEKCQILCSECHKIKTLEARDHPYGEDSSGSKLTEAQVLKIRSDWAAGKYRFRTEIAKKYNVDKKTITNVINRNDWTHI